jgi:hypothetical protein
MNLIIKNRIESVKELFDLNNIKYEIINKKIGTFNVYDLNNKKYKFNAVSGEISGYKDSGAVTILRIALLDKNINKK